MPICSWSPLQVLTSGRIRIAVHTELRIRCSLLFLVGNKIYKSNSPRGMPLVNINGQQGRQPTIQDEGEGACTTELR